jgi:hypothetical protein
MHYTTWAGNTAVMLVKNLLYFLPALVKAGQAFLQRGHHARYAFITDCPCYRLSVTADNLFIYQTGQHHECKWAIKTPIRALMDTPVLQHTCSWRARREGAMFFVVSHRLQRETVPQFAWTKYGQQTRHNTNVVAGWQSVFYQSMCVSCRKLWANENIQRPYPM